MLLYIAMGKTLGHKIGMLLADRRMDNQALAASMGVANSTVGRWVKDEQKPSVFEAFRVARFFGVSLDWLADNEQDYPPPSGPAAVVGVIDVPPQSPPSLEPKGNHLPTGKGVNGPTKRTRKR